MALGDITRDESSPRIQGNTRVLTGTLEASNTLTAFALADTASYLLDVRVSGEDGESDAQVLLNQDASGTTTNGTVAIRTNHKEVGTLRYVATLI